MHKPLPPRDWAWDGGRPSLDLVNTFRNRKTGGWELLRTPGDLDAWLAAAGLVEADADSGQLAAAREARTDSTQLAPARELREAIHRCASGTPSPGDVELVNGWAARRKATVLQLAPDLSVVRPAPERPVEAALAEIAHDAIDLIGGEEWARLRVCASPECGLCFVDRSNAGKRQWCSMKRCGNREKVRLHRARRTPE
ncbi:CGNR zinc finger domain-containing protein [Streptosporangium sp. NPDC003464]